MVFSFDLRILLLPKSISLHINRSIMVFHGIIFAFSMNIQFKIYLIFNNYYFEFIKNENLPIGSGAMESSIRRVINMRLKGAATYWLKENAEGMLMLRSYFKSGRWNMLKRLALSSKHLLEG